MNREHLYKAKRKNWRKSFNKEWIEGYYVKIGDNHFILTAHAANEGFIEDFEIDPDTVCEYTGLQGKDGRKIFEGDIINDIDYGIMKCIYLHGSFVWYKEDGFKMECMRYVPIVEIIGNVFDNPELLKREAENE